MAVSSAALFSLLTEDLSPHLSVDQEIAALIGGSVPIYPDSDPENFASAHLLNNFLKKFMDSVEKDADQKALDKFLESNRLCERWSWSKAQWSLRDDLLVGTFKSIIHRVFSDPALSFDDLQCLSSMGDLGSGVNVRSRGTDLYSKLYDSTLTCSKPSIFDLYQRYVTSMPRHQSAEFIRTLTYGHSVDVCDSKLSFVPKSNVISRTICTEPTLNMWYQRAYSANIEKVLFQSFGIDLSRQPDINRELSRIGSRDNSFATIDLASASDSISLKFLADVLPKQAYTILNFFRSERTDLPSGEKVQLHMVSSMGNGYTFSLQTLIFCCMVEAVYTVYCKALHKPYHSPKGIHLGNFGVFGDDIIVEKDLFPPLNRLLVLCGFRVNTTKSFSEGPFRESCGADFLNGINVRPVFCKSLRDEYSRFATINLLRYWSSRLRIGLPRSIRFLMSTVRFLPIPRSSPIEAGLHVPLACLPRIVRNANMSILFRMILPTSTKYKVDWDRVVSPRFGRKKSFNPDGLILYALSGGLRDGCFSVRQDRSYFRLRRNISPNWDMPPMGPDPLDPAGWARWSSESLVFCQHFKP